MQLLSSAAFSLGHGGNDSQSNGYYHVAVYINTSGVAQESPSWLDVVLQMMKVPLKCFGFL
jgi:PiT family inorganic phosphate transporter